MSRILASGLHESGPIPVVLGWDRPLRHCFLQIDLDDDLWEDPRFEKVARAAEDTVLRPLSPADIVRALHDAELEVPRAVFDELRRHIDSNAGNVIVRFHPDGQRELVYQEAA